MGLKDLFKDVRKMTKDANRTIKDVTEVTGIGIEGSADKEKWDSKKSKYDTRQDRDDMKSAKYSLKETEYKLQEEALLNGKGGDYSLTRTNNRTSTTTIEGTVGRREIDVEINREHEGESRRERGGSRENDVREQRESSRQESRESEPRGSRRHYERLAEEKRSEETITTRQKESDREVQERYGRGDSNTVATAQEVPSKRDTTIRGELPMDTEFDERLNGMIKQLAGNEFKEAHVNIAAALEKTGRDVTRSPVMGDDAKGNIIEAGEFGAWMKETNPELAKAIKDADMTTGKGRSDAFDALQGSLTNLQQEANGRSVAQGRNQDAVIVPTIAYEEPRISTEQLAQAFIDGDGGAKRDISKFKRRLEDLNDGVEFKKGSKADNFNEPGFAELLTKTINEHATDQQIAALKSGNPDTIQDTLDDLQKDMRKSAKFEKKVDKYEDSISLENINDKVVDKLSNSEYRQMKDDLAELGFTNNDLATNIRDYAQHKLDNRENFSLPPRMRERDLQEAISLDVVASAGQPLVASQKDDVLAGVDGQKYDVASDVPMAFNKGTPLTPAEARAKLQEWGKQAGVNERDRLVTEISNIEAATGTYNKEFEHVREEYKEEIDTNVAAIRKRQGKEPQTASTPNNETLETNISKTIHELTGEDYGKDNEHLKTYATITAGLEKLNIKVDKDGVINGPGDEYATWLRDADPKLAKAIETGSSIERQEAMQLSFDKLESSVREAADKVNTATTISGGKDVDSDQVSKPIMRPRSDTLMAGGPAIG